MTRLKKKGWIISLLLAIVLVYMAMPLYMPVSTKLNLTNDKAQIAVYNDGFQNNSVKLLSKVDNSVFGKCKKNGTACAGYSITENITNKWKRRKIRFEALGDGIVYVDLRGVQVTDYNSEKHAMLVDYRNFTVNRVPVFKNVKTYSHDNTFQYSMSVKNGDILRIDVEIRNHLPKLSQVKKLTFLSILILAFLLSYKLVQYAAKFKILENNSRIDIVFVAVFALLLFIPMSHISNAEKSLQENRMLAKSPQFVQENGINEAFGEQFNSWFNDRFFGRTQLISLYDKIRYLPQTNIGNDDVIIGLNGWLFYKGKSGINNFANNASIPIDDFKKGLKYLKSFNEWCKKNGKEFYYIITPDKNKIYGEYYNRSVRKINPDKLGLGQQFADYVKANSDIKVEYLYDVLHQNKDKGLLYYKHDTHWNDFGAYFGYAKIMEMMGLQPKSYQFKKVNKKGDLDNMIKTDEDDTLYNQPNLDLNTFCSGNQAKMFCKNPSGNKNLFILRDSFATSLLLYLSNDFNKIYAYQYDEHFVHHEDLELIKNEVDIVVVQNVERFLPFMMVLKFPEE